MEHFEPKPNPSQQKVKEKNLYIVHLDTPRIIILSSVVIGIIAASFLFGMSFFKDKGDPTKNLAINDTNISSKDEDLFGKVTDEESKIKSEDLKIDEDSELLSKDDKSEETIKSEDILKGTEIAGVGTKVKEEKVDVLTKENIKAIIPPSKTKKQVAKSSVKKERKSVAKAPVRKSAKVKSAAVRNNKKNESRYASGEKESKVVQVSKNVRSYTTPRSGGFSVQVASYDRQFKAERERSLLKSRNYDAYVDRTIVNGKNYYRVKIGPVGSRDKAASLLNGVQRDSRYANSYITRD